MVLFQTYSTIFIFRQIDRANFAVRGPSSLIEIDPVVMNKKYKIRKITSLLNF